MSVDKRKVLIVDDSAEDLHLLMECLKSGYAVLAATSGENALQLATKEPLPDAILLDVEMPGMNGYEVCRHLKGNRETKDIDVIFVSAHDSTDEKLAGYEVGGCDYLIKPVQPLELLQKVKMAVQNREQRHNTEEARAKATSTAAMAMSDAGEQGIVLNFMRQSYQIEGFIELAQLIVDACQQYGLECCVQIRSSSEITNVASYGWVSPLEEELLLRLKDVGRIKEMGSRCVANFGDISLLIKNMPEDDDRRGRMRDHLEALLEAAESRGAALEMELKIARVLESSNKILEEFRELQECQSVASVSIIDAVKDDVEQVFAECALTERQEELLLDSVRRGVKKTLENRGRGDSIEEKVESLLQSMVEHISQ